MQAATSNQSEPENKISLIQSLLDLQKQGRVMKERTEEDTPKICWLLQPKRNEKIQ